MIQKSWGAEMRFELGDVRPGVRGDVVVSDRQGKREIGGEWGSDHGPDEAIAGSASFRVDSG